MLTNYSTLGYSLTGEDPINYTNAVGLQEIPEIGTDPEKVDITCLADSVKRYELGVGAAPELQYTFLVMDINSESSPYRVFKKAEEDKSIVYFKQSTKNGEISTEFSGEVSVKLSGGGLNSALTFTLTVGLKSDFVFTYGNA